jgi:hypothetical protein
VTCFTLVSLVFTFHRVGVSPSARDLACRTEGGAV